MRTYSFLFLAMLMTSGCSKVPYWPCDKATGELITKKLTLDHVTMLEDNIHGDIFIVQDKGATGSTLEIRAQQLIHDKVNTNVENGTLRLEYQEKCVRNTKPVTITLTVADIDRISLEGSGNIKSKGKIETDELTVRIAGSGDVTLSLTTNELSASIAGSGTIKCTGSATNQKLRVSGSGDVLNYGLESESVEVRIAGSSDVQVTANKQLDVRISGSGDVHYKGYPSINQSISGSGKVSATN